MRDLIIKSAEEKIQELTQQLQKELKYYTKHKNSLYDYAKKQSEIEFLNSIQNSIQMQIYNLMKRL